MILDVIGKADLMCPRNPLKSDTRKRVAHMMTIITNGRGPSIIE